MRCPSNARYSRRDVKKKVEPQNANNPSRPSFTAVVQLVVTAVFPPLIARLLAPGISSSDALSELVSEKKGKGAESVIFVSRVQLVVQLELQLVVR